MKVHNLDKYKKKQQIILDGKTYEVKGLSVRMYLEDERMNKLDETASDKETVRIMVDLLSEITNIPTEVIKDQDIEVLKALVAVSQGEDPDQEGSDQEGSEAKKN